MTEKEEIKTPEETKKRTGFFTDEKGTLSMRRLLAFMFAMTMIVAIPLNIECEMDWRIACVTIGLPLIGSLLMMFFTSWSDIAAVASSVKK